MAMFLLRTVRINIILTIVIDVVDDSDLTFAVAFVVGAVATDPPHLDSRSLEA